MIERRPLGISLESSDYLFKNFVERLEFLILCRYDQPMSIARLPKREKKNITDKTISKPKEQ